MLGSFLFSCKHLLFSTSGACRRLSSQACDPLRILFCGSDEFSIVSLRALHREKHFHPGLIASIDVVCRPPKPVRRNLEAVREVPVAAVARNLRLPLHQIETFTEWTAPVPAQGPINLVIAVSFGLLVSPRILKLAKYGGLNVHPSILPEFRGPAPLHHTLLNGRRTTGVTLQTLHPTRFDGGKTIDQTPYPGIEHGAETVEDLRDVLAPMGADMLVQSIRNYSFVPPIQQASESEAFQTSAVLTYASKVGPKDRHIDWATWTATDILRRQKIIGPLWNTTEAQIEGQIMIEASLAARRTGLVPISANVGAFRQSSHDFVAFHARLT
ncbi:MAG: hypothetical protein Q9185_001472 [Variospora sp. 1 TL-2023]